MTQEEFLNKIEGCMNDFEAGISMKSDTCNNILQVFLDALSPFVRSKEHLQLFMYRVHKMRDTQKEFHAGNYKLLSAAKKMEADVDKAINKLCSDFRLYNGRYIQ